MSRGRAGLALAVLAACALVGWAVVIAPRLPAGPLAAAAGAPNRLAFAVDVGRSFSYGLVVLENESTLPARLMGIELVDGDTGLQVVSSAVRSLRDAPDRGVVANERAFPPSGLADVLRPAVGAAIPPFEDDGDGVELVLELRVDRPGAHGFGAVAVRYRQDGHEYRAVFPYALRVCAPRTITCGTVGAPARILEGNSSTRDGRTRPAPNSTAAAPERHDEGGASRDQPSPLDRPAGGPCHAARWQRELHLLPVGRRWRRPRAPAVHGQGDPGEHAALGRRAG